MKGGKAFYFRRWVNDLFCLAILVKRVYKSRMPPKKKEEVQLPALIGRVGTNLKIGIVGLPNVGKSTFFNILTKSQAAAENFPFCTIDPNERVFDDEEIVHVEGEVDPVRDLNIIHDELRYKDIEYLKKQTEGLERSVNRGGDKKKKPEYIDILNMHLFLTAKPVIYLVNLSEKDFIRKKNKCAMDKIIVQGYKALQLLYFFTTGKDEVKAWTIQAAGKYKQKGRDYIVDDGDIILFKFNAVNIFTLSIYLSHKCNWLGDAVRPRERSSVSIRQIPVPIWCLCAAAAIRVKIVVRMRHVRPVGVVSLWRFVFREDDRKRDCHFSLFHKSLFDVHRLTVKTKMIEKLILKVLFANDCALMTCMESAFQLIVNKITEAAYLFGLIISLGKTEVLFQPSPPTTEPSISIERTELKTGEI
ncbi:OLA1 [Acanthosepion pharaonis]|uniref:OLA1 n=1 Tax=Acanthosepion pharaonis TaxID=158019 RepID=A0A812AQ62_ACAPH|nr:OLA1 [Sepia pharaonis]